MNNNINSQDITTTIIWCYKCDNSDLAEVRTVDLQKFDNGMEIAEAFPYLSDKEINLVLDGVCITCS